MKFFGPIVEYFGNAPFSWLWSGQDYCWITLLLDFELWTKAQCEAELRVKKKGKIKKKRKNLNNNNFI